MQQIAIIGALPYYNEAREDCHLIKDGDAEAINRQAARIADCLPETDYTLIPIPGRHGIAISSKQFAEALALIIKGQEESRTTATVLDCLFSNIHPSFCELKEAGKGIEDIPLTMYIKGDMKADFEKAQKSGKTICLVDNVVDTGKTVRAAFKVTGNIPVIAVGDTENHNNNNQV